MINSPLVGDSEGVKTMNGEYSRALAGSASSELAK
jgi:hypothetical protein